MKSAAPIYYFSAPLPDGGKVSMEEFRGSVLLIVNTASHCGFTPQYAALESLHRQYRDRGLAVLAFPCNQFGAQEPGSAAEIGAFCARNFGVSFPVFAKIDVNGPHAHPLFGYLKKQRSGLFGLFTGGRIVWNFTKFIVDRKGNVTARYGPSKAPALLAPMLTRLLDVS